jgi:hypothetical protein
MSQYTTGIEDYEQGYGEPSVSQSLQEKDRDRQSSCSPSRILLPTYVSHPVLRLKLNALPLCVPGSSFTHKAINSEINSNLVFIQRKLLQDQEV